MDDEPPIPVVPTATRAANAVPTGGQKRRRVNALPVLGILLAAGSKQIYGVVNIIGVRAISDAGTAETQYLEHIRLGGPAAKAEYVSWEISDVCPFAGGVVTLQSADFKYQSLVCDLSQKGTDNFKDLSIVVDGKIIALRSFLAPDSRFRLW